jgi:signal transduction histidine kinase
MNFMPLSLVPLLVVGLLAITQTRFALQRAAEDKLAGMAAIKKAQVEGIIAGKLATVRVAADLVEGFLRQAFEKAADARDAQRLAVVRLLEAVLLDAERSAGDIEIVRGAVELSSGDPASAEARGRMRAYLARFMETRGCRDAFFLDTWGTVLVSLRDPALVGTTVSRISAGGLAELQRRLGPARERQAVLAAPPAGDGPAGVLVGAPVFIGTSRLGLIAFDLPVSRMCAAAEAAGPAGWSGQSCFLDRQGWLHGRPFGPSARARAEGRGSVPKRITLTGTGAGPALLCGAAAVALSPGFSDSHCVAAADGLGVEGLDWILWAEQEATEALLPQGPGGGMFVLTHFAQSNGYEDILLVQEDGFVFHTVMRGPDFRTNLLTGAFKSTNLGRMVQEVLASGREGIADYSPYPPAGNKPVGFLAVPLNSEEAPIMAVVVQLSPGWIDAVMGERTGMGKTGETLLVGPDFRMRSSSFLDPLEHSMEASFFGTVEKNGMASREVRAALSGKTGSHLSPDRDYRGQTVFSAYTPVQVGSLTWALLAKQDISEAFLPARRQTLILALAASIAAVVAAAISLWAADRLAQPVLRLAGAARAVADGRLGADLWIPAGRRDEVGVLAESFQAMTRQLQDLINGLEERVQERTQELESANRELESFSYSVSHDLRAPLRAIDGYAQMLEEDHRERLDTEGRRILAVVRSEARRMGLLIDDLLRFARLGKQTVFLEMTDMTGMVKEVFAELRAAHPGRTVELRLSPLPPGQADRNLIRQAWTNVLGNAFKFTSRRERAVIEVSGEANGTDVVYSVRDNGAGFSMDYADKLFGVFQRLHQQEEFEGTGVGLALVQRILERHGGRIWAEGKVEQGACFWFTLPAERNGKDG